MSQEINVPRFKPIEKSLFSTMAEDCAKVIAANGKGTTGKLEKNKSTQLRRFYDEICLWQEKNGSEESKFNDNLPFIHMIAAKVAYAKGRNLVDDSFLKLIQEGLNQVDSLQTFNTFKTFMEAFMGFYKMHSAEK